MDKMKNRREEIRNLLSVKETMSIKALSEYFSVTGATIRADIREMERHNEISRSNGMVSLMRPYVVNLNVKEKIFINAEQKERIGACAAAMIQDGDSIIVTSGTTIESLARHITSKGELNVVTPSISVALSLTQKDNINIYALGGKVQKTSLSVRNDYSLKGLENVCASKLFMSCDGFDFSTGVITATQEEAALTKAMMKVSGQVILLADSTKLGKTGFGRICELKEIDILITDENLPEKAREKMERLGVHVEIAK